jgi:hypothetical protein
MRKMHQLIAIQHYYVIFAAVNMFHVARNHLAFRTSKTLKNCFFSPFSHLNIVVSAC